MAIPQSFIQELVSRADVVEVVGRHVQLKKSGANFMGLCPFHGEKSPSFSVSPTKQFYHCFGCGANGDALRFMMEYEGMGFLEAVRELAQQHGLDVPDDASPQDRAQAAAQRQKQATLTDVLDKAGDAYRKALRTAPRAVDYLRRRGLSGEIAKRFGLGYAPEGWRHLAGVFPDYAEPLLVESGLVISSAENGAPPSAEAKRYDRFRDRVMFPIRNVKGECIGFGGRVLGDEKPKYLNSPETPVFSKGRELYGLFEARAALREHGYALVTEGYMDVVALAQLGFPNAVATLGTACTPEHLQKLLRFTDAVTFSFDGDAAGRRAARKALDAALPLATDVRSIRFLFLPSEHDPDSFIRAHGKDAFAGMVESALPLSRFLVESAREGCDLSTAEGRARMQAAALPLWSALPEEGGLRRQLLADIAEQVRLDAQELASLWAAQAPRPRTRAAAAPEHAGAAAPQDAPADFPPYDDAPWHPYEPASAGGWDQPAGWGERPASPRAGGREGPGAGRGGRPGWKSRGNGGAGSDWRGGGGGWKSGGMPDAARAPRSRPPSRADHAARLLLRHMELLEHLGDEDHAMLCELPAPHGPVFAWLEGQFHEHGALDWPGLQAAMLGAECDDDALRILRAHPVPAAGADAAGPSPHELRLELRGLLNLMLVERIKQQEKEALAALERGEPEASLRYRALQQRKRELLAPVGPKP
ncbi:MAG: DNA primase [Xylophilus ampelinus]